MTSTSINDFKIEKIIGKGSFGNVYLVTRKIDQKIYALKTVILEKLSLKEQENSVNEVRILASINHPNIIGYKEAFWNDKESSLNIVMEYADDGDLQSKISKMKKYCGKFTENIIWSYAIQMISGLKSLHDKKIMHRDLKSANIFLLKNKHQCKIGDMNVSKVIKNKVLFTQTGTPYYASPEVWKDMPYSYKSDLWSIGCIIYELCELHPPFNGKDLDELYINVCKGKIKRINNIYSDDLWKIILMLLQVDVNKRVDCDEFLNNKLVLKKINEIKFLDKEYINLEKNNNYINSELLQTIKFKNIREIKAQLPLKKNYNKNENEEKSKEEINKKNFFLENEKLFREIKKQIDANELLERQIKIKKEIQKIKETERLIRQRNNLRQIMFNYNKNNNSIITDKERIKTEEKKINYYKVKHRGIAAIPTSTKSKTNRTKLNEIEINNSNNYNYNYSYIKKEKNSITSINSINNTGESTNEKYNSCKKPTRSKTPSINTGNSLIKNNQSKNNKIQKTLRQNSYSALYSINNKKENYKILKKYHSIKQINVSSAKTSQRMEKIKNKNDKCITSERNKFELNSSQKRIKTFNNDNKSRKSYDIKKINVKQNNYKRGCDEKELFDKKRGYNTNRDLTEPELLMILNPIKLKDNNHRSGNNIKKRLNISVNDNQNTFLKHITKVKVTNINDPRSNQYYTINEKKNNIINNQSTNNNFGGINNNLLNSKVPVKVINVFN